MAILLREQRALVRERHRRVDQPISVVTKGNRLLDVVGIVPAQLRLHDLVAFGVGPALDIGCVEEHTPYRQIKKARDPERYFQRRWLLTGFDRHCRLTAHADDLCQFLQRHLTTTESTPPSDVANGHDHSSCCQRLAAPGDVEGRHSHSIATVEHLIELAQLQLQPHFADW